MAVTSNLKCNENSNLLFLTNKDSLAASPGGEGLEGMGGVGWEEGW